MVGYYLGIYSSRMNEKEGNGDFCSKSSIGLHNYNSVCEFQNVMDYWVGTVQTFWYLAHRLEQCTFKI